MTVMNDAWIISESNRESTVVLDRLFNVIEFVPDGLPVETEEELAKGWSRGTRRNPNLCLIEPFLEESIRVLEGTETPAVSFGVQPYCYDVRLSDELELFTNLHGAVLDPKRPNPKAFTKPVIHVSVEGERYVIIPPNSYLLGRTVEYLRIPKDELVFVMGKSTYARIGTVINPTLLQPAFNGQVVVEIGNNTNLPARCYIDEGICSLVFFKGNAPPKLDYGQKGGKFQGQEGLVHAFC